MREVTKRVVTNRCQRVQSRPIRADSIEQAAITIRRRITGGKGIPFTVFCVAGELFCAAGDSAAAAIVNHTRDGLVCNYSRAATLADIIDDLREEKWQP